ncbi:uncharacterized protein MONBRDRAFT_4831 [Monosiga brevicollis MX1]|uniref:Uncharacterized protein n=1 Tax=Monosiga brevicollis TaxID=81824 RepID=A9UP27_MONBE|nr:uncharacterized protein MONBRDRAFT_4831 [Monosiga brevicollis MX1]EDQ92801.1 predicted protein [Monosiga brevicollis MX1]|eukprot:XP_001742563.1 hypothetical protein [Monosiga brevicollis MX1]
MHDVTIKDHVAQSNPLLIENGKVSLVIRGQLKVRHQVVTGVVNAKIIGRFPNDRITRRSEVSSHALVTRRGEEPKGAQHHCKQKHTLQNLGDSQRNNIAFGGLLLLVMSVLLGRGGNYMDSRGRGHLHKKPKNERRRFNDGRRRAAADMMMVCTTQSS